MDQVIKSFNVIIGNFKIRNTQNQLEYLKITDCQFQHYEDLHIADHENLRMDHYLFLRL